MGDTRERGGESGVRVAVVGAGGFVGRRLCTALSERHVDLMTFSSQADGCFDGQSGILQDLPRTSGLNVLVYLAQSPHYRELPQRAQHVWGVNVVSAIKAADWACQSGAERIIYASTGSVYEPSFEAHRETDLLRRDAWYPLSKIHAEEALGLTAARQVTSARLFSIYGPGQNSKLIPGIISQVRAGRPVKLQPHVDDDHDNEGLRLSLCYVEDAIQVLMRLIDEGGPPILNVASPEVLSVREIALAVGRHLGVTPQFEIDPEPRAFDLIADTTRVSTMIKSFTTFEAGLASTMSHVVMEGDASRSAQ